MAAIANSNRFNWRLYVLIIIFLNAFFGLISKEVLAVDELMKLSMSDILTNKEIYEIFENQKKYNGWDIC